VRKLIQGIVTFRQGMRPEYKETFAHLALGQKPDCLFIACSDSRVVPNLFASTEPGDLFVTRNVGNLVPPGGPGGVSTGDEAEAAAIEYAVTTLGVQDIVVCGHSSCGAMQVVLDAARGARTDGASLPVTAGAPNLTRWLRHALPALEKLESGATTDPSLPPVDILSQLNVLDQVAHVKTYPAVADRLQSSALGVHAWWFDIANADVYAHDPDSTHFLLLDEQGATRLLTRLAR
jgi:carbonic anhydrase